MSKKPYSITGSPHDMIRQPVEADDEVMLRLYEAYRRHRQKFIRAEDLEAELDEAIAAVEAPPKDDE